ncbi:MAG: hypothetical protein ABS70_01910 [Nitrospira sp. SCN 59-13]|nr:MAG: hypothetical protein ABS70_01910 [Nitrospira sp. SCN 59-13]
MISVVSHNDLLPMPHWDKSSSDRPQKTMIPIAAMTKTMSNITGAKEVTCFIALPSLYMRCVTQHQWRFVTTLYPGEMKCR